MAKDEINAFLGAGTVFNGILTFQGAVRIDGGYSGEIQSAGVLIAGKDAKIEGKIQVGEFSLAGSFIGDVVAEKKITIYKGGVLKGTVKCPALVIEEGATLDGRIEMSQNDSVE